MANFTVSWVTTETTASMTARLTNGDTSFVGDRYVRIYINGRLRTTLTEYSPGGYAIFTETISGLSSGTTYTWVTELGYKATGASSITWVSELARDGDFTTDEAIIEVDPWSWTSSNGSATSTQTRNAYYAVTGNGAVSNFSYRVWNDLVDKTKEILDANGYSWSNNFASYYETLMTSSDRELTADRFNSLRFNIGAHASTGIATVRRGDTVYGWYFTQLTDSLNSLI